MVFNPRQNQWSLGKTIPSGWTPAVIKHYLVDIDIQTNNKEIRFKFKSQSTKYTGTTIEDVIRENPPSSLLSIEDNPLDINAQQECYIIIELTSDFDWQFSRDGDGITLKDNFSNRFVDLTHVFKDGSVIKGGSQMKPGCRMVYFAVIDPPKGEHPFNMHVDLLYPAMTPEARLPIVIDPDIKHPGGTD